ncbi:MAG: hypothetical protein HYW49_12625 [Deltaproteobacteria bacterium]|nr:hypothetical protein [Deltaproteobacteria bacterium]
MKQAVRSEYLGEKQLAGINKIGDCYLPACGEFPSFSQSGCIAHVDRVIAFVPEQDLGDLKMILGLFAVLPKPLVWLILRCLEFLFENGLPLGTMPRQIRFGLRGIVFSLYYASEDPLRKLDYKTGVYIDDLRHSN